MAEVEEAATSWLVMPARLARSGSIFSLTPELSVSQSLRTPAVFGQGAEECLPVVRPGGAACGCPPRDCAALTSALLAIENVHGEVDGGVLQLADIDARAGNAGRQDRLQVMHELGRDLLVRHLHDDLRVVQLLQLRGHREPEARAASTDEGGHVFQDVLGLAVFAGMLLAELLRFLAHDLFHLLRGLVGGVEVGVVGKPDVDVGPVLHVSGMNDVFSWT